MAERTQPYKYQFITDLPEEWEDWRDHQLLVLADLWKEDRDRLESLGTIKQFNERLRRQWAIETGLIERIYHIDDAVSKTLIEHGLEAASIPPGSTDKSPEEIIAILKDHEEALEAIRDIVRGDRPLTMAFIRNLHKIIVRHQDECEAVDSLGKRCRVKLIKGDWKKWPNHLLRNENIWHEFAPPEHTQAEMEKLLAWHGEHLKKGVSAEIEAAWLHHRFTQIHPFQDSNGRVARALATVILLRGGYFPLVVRLDEKGRYIEALQKADENDLQPLIGFFSELQRRAFKEALRLAQEVEVEEKGKPYQEVIKRAAEELKLRKESWFEAVLARASALQNRAVQAFEAVKESLQESGIRSLAPQFSRAEEGHYYSAQIVQMAKSFDYFANLQRPRLWTRMRILEPFPIDLVASFHFTGGFGKKLMMAAVLFLSRTISGEEEHEKGFIAEEACIEPFWLTDREPAKAVLDREFDRWLIDAITVALAKWRRTIK